MKKSFLIGATCALVLSLVISPNHNHLVFAQNSAQTTIKEFSRTAKADGLMFNFVLLNDKTVDLLFSGDSKYAMRAKANMATVFYVQGVSEKDITLDPQFEVIQEGKTYPAEAVNLKNLQAGPMPKGTKFSGLIQLAEKINVAQPFTIKTANTAAEFKLSKDALSMLSN